MTSIASTECVSQALHTDISCLDDFLVLLLLLTLRCKAPITSFQLIQIAKSPINMPAAGLQISDAVSVGLSLGRSSSEPQRASPAKVGTRCGAAGRANGWCVRGSLGAPLKREPCFVSNRKSLLSNPIGFSRNPQTAASERMLPSYDLFCAPRGAIETPRMQGTHVR